MGFYCSYWLIPNKLGDYKVRNSFLTSFLMQGIGKPFNELVYSIQLFELNFGFDKSTSLLVGFGKIDRGADGGANRNQNQSWSPAKGLTGRMVFAGVPSL